MGPVSASPRGDCPARSAFAWPHWAGFRIGPRAPRIGAGSLARWEETAARFGDMEEDGYRRMLGVETTNVCTESVRLDPGGEVTLSSECAVGPP